MELSRLRFASKFDGFFFSCVRLRFRCVSILSGISRSPWNSWELWELWFSWDAEGGIQPTIVIGMLEHLGASWVIENLRNWLFRPPAPKLYSPQNPPKIARFFLMRTKIWKFFPWKKRSELPCRSEVTSLRSARPRRVAVEFGARLGVDQPVICWSHIFLGTLRWDYVQCIMKILLFIYILI